MKAQSAIEYLVTYGWMLVAVSVVSGAVYSTVGNECIESTSGFTGSEIQITNFGTSADANNISLQVESRSSEVIEINRIEFEFEEDSRELDIPKELRPYEPTAVGIPGFRKSESCNSLDATIHYDLGPLENQRASGTLTADIEFDDTLKPLEPESFDAAFPKL